MIAHSFKATFEGKPLSVLNELIQKRKKWLGETYKQSVVATAITALRSIRAITLNHYGKSEVYIGDDVSITRRADIHPSFSGKSHVRCFRVGASATRKAPRAKLDRPCVQLVPPSDLAWLNSSVYVVKLSKERLERWPKNPEQFYVAATSEDAVMSYVKKKFSKIIKRESGLARAVLGSLMAKLSTRPPARESAGDRVSKTVNKFGAVRENDAGRVFSVHVESNLSYARDAVKGGQSGINNALKSAANKIAGIIKHMAGAKLDEDLRAPFPEVKKR